MRNNALALATALLILPAAAAAADDGRPGATAPVPGGDPAASAPIEASGPVPPQPPFALRVAFGTEALGGAGQCDNPSERAWHHCRLRLAEGGRLALDPPDHAVTAVGVRFEVRF